MLREGRLCVVCVTQTPLPHPAKLLIINNLAGQVMETVCHTVTTIATTIAKLPIHTVQACLCVHVCAQPHTQAALYPDAKI